MATKITTIALLMIISMATIFSTCKKGGLGCADTVYNFQLEAHIKPDLDSIHKKDTIWLEINSPTILTDVSSGKTVNFSNASNLGTAISFVKFIGGSVSNPGAEYAANDFNTYVSEGRQVNNPFVEGIREYLFLEENNSYKFKLAIIPEKDGIYSIGLSNAGNVYRKTDKCVKAGFEIDFEGTDQHLYFLQNNRPGYTISDYEQRHLYCFKVY